MKVHKIFLLKCPRMPQHREIPGYQNISRIPESIEMIGNIGTKRANCMADYSLILISIFSIHVFGPMFLFVTPENNRKPKVFSGVQKWEHCTNRCDVLSIHSWFVESGLTSLSKTTHPVSKIL